MGLGGAKNSQSQHEDEESLRNLMPPPDGANIKTSSGGSADSSNNGANDGCRNESLNSHDLIVMTADQCIKEQ